MTRFAETILFLLAASSLAGQDAEVVPIDLYVNGRAEGNISCRIAEGSISAEKAKLVQSLQNLLEAQHLRDLQNAAGASEFVDVAGLEKYGVESRYDPGALRLDLVVSPGDQQARILSLGRPPPANLAVERPSDFSAYLNLRALTTVQTTAVGGAPLSSSFPSQLILQPVVNYRGWVLDAGATSSLASTWSISLDYARVSHDFVDHDQRLAIGSLFMPVTGFMVSRSSYGVEFFQDPRMTLSLHGFAALPTQFLLNQASTVSVLLNSSMLGAFELDAGRYTVPNVQFEDGLNSLTVRSDDVLLQQVIPYDSRLLGQGVMSYSAGLGVPQWELVPPVFSGFFRYGITSFLTVGGYTQDSLGTQMGGAEATYATPIGNFHAQLGLSHAADFDAAAEFDYRLAFRYGAYYPVVGLSAQYTGSGFSTPGSASGQSPYAWAFAASYSQPLPYQFGLGVGFGYQVGWAPNPDALSATVTVSRPVSGNAAVNCIVSCTQQGGAPVQVQVTIMLSSVRDRARESIFAATSLDRPYASTDFRYQPSPLLPGGAFSISKDGDTLSADVGLQYTTPFVDSSLSDAISPSANALTLSAGVALVTAGGAFAVSRPVSDSFAILLPRYNMLGQTVVVDRTPDSYAGMVTGKVNIGVPDLASYTRRTVNLSSPTAPADSDLGPSVRVLQPTYKSGTVLAVGTRAAVVMSGKLTFDGAPVAFRAGKVASASRSEVFFTDADGSFQAYRLEPGTWTLSIDGVGTQKEIVVPESAERQFDAGSIALEETR